MKKKVIFTIFIVILFVGTLFFSIWIIVGVDKPLDTIAGEQAGCITNGHIGYYRNLFGQCFTDSEGTKRIDESEIYNIDSEIYAEPMLDANGNVCRDENNNVLTLKDKYKATGHELQFVSATAATCTEDGVVAHWYCQKCKNNYSDNNGQNLLSVVTEPALGHKGNVKKYCRYLNNSTHQYFCERVGCPGSEPEYCAYGEWTTPEDCTASRDISRECEFCGNVDVEENAPLSSHIWGSWQVTPATCEDDGLKIRTCAACKQIDQEVLPARGHNFEYVKGTPATCTEAGENAHRYCKNCNKDFSLDREVEMTEKELTIKATGHSFEYVKGTPATCTEAGENAHRHCNTCNKDFSVDSEVEMTRKDLIMQATGHTPVIKDNYWEDLSHYVAPTVSTYAKIPYYCSGCGEFLEVKQWSDAESDETVRRAIRIEDKYYADTTIMYDEKIGSLGLNLLAMDDNLTGLGYSGYDSSSHVLKISSSYNGKGVAEAKIIGRPNVFTNLAIETGAFNNLKLILQNISFTAPSGHAGLNLGNATYAELIIMDNVVITGAAGAEGDGIGKAGIIASTLSIKGDSLTVTGGKGADKKKSKDGKDNAGGAGIEVKNDLSLDLEGFLTVTGGIGGKGAKGSTPSKSGTGSGGTGYMGGAGGAGINANIVNIVGSAKYTISGGQGGEGGNGGNSVNKYVASKNKAGNGGNGGTGAVAVYATKLNISTSLTVELCKGNGGKGGDAGFRDTRFENGALGTGGRGGLPADSATNASVMGTYNENQATQGSDGGNGGNWHSQDDYSNSAYWN